jgi:hypothetical protein
MAYNKITLNGETKIDLTQDTVTAEDVALGKTFHLNSGEIATGTLEITSGGGEDMTQETFTSFNAMYKKLKNLCGRKACKCLKIELYFTSLTGLSSESENTVFNITDSSFSTSKASLTFNPGNSLNGNILGAYHPTYPGYIQAIFVESSKVFAGIIKDTGIEMFYYKTEMSTTKSTITCVKEYYKIPTNASAEYILTYFE